jgi:lipooligosaccharide transport system permease protein
VSFFWILVEPTVIFGAIGFGVGSYINNVAGVSYIDFFFPALLCSTAMIVSFFESTYGNFSKLTYQQTYVTMILSPIEPSQIVAGEILWAATKGTLSSIGVALVALPLGVLESWRIFPAFFVIFISAFLFGSLGMLVTSMVKNYDSIIYPTSGLIVPMSMLSGTYFPIDQLPVALRFLVYGFPLTHSVALVRALVLNKMEWYQLSHLATLILFAVVFFQLANKRIFKKLIH